MPYLSAAPREMPSDGSAPTGGVSQMAYARVVTDPVVAPAHPSDATPRLLLVKSTIGEYAKGRLLLSPWSAFRGVFPMHGTYFAQNEVFEDEAAGEVTLPLASLGAERRVYLGKSIEGVLRRRTAAELSILFQRSYVCIRRFRSTDGRLLPLVLDPPRLLKHKATPSALAMQVGLARPMDAPSAVTTATLPAPADTMTDEAIASAVAAAAIAAALGVAQDAESFVSGGTLLSDADESGDEVEGGDAGAAEDDEGDDGDRTAAIARGLRLFSLYVAAGGALCMRPIVWRRLMPALHPDKGGDAHVFQYISELKRRVDGNEEVRLPELPPLDEHDARLDRIYTRIRSELQEAAAEIGGEVARRVKGL